MSTKKTYFLAPNFDIPTSGLVALGSIIPGPREPESALNENERVEVPASSIYHSDKTDWQSTREQLHEGKCGVWMNFLIDIGGIGSNHSKDIKEVYKFDHSGDPVLSTG